MTRQILGCWETVNCEWSFRLLFIKGTMYLYVYGGHVMQITAVFLPVLVHIHIHIYVHADMHTHKCAYTCIYTYICYITLQYIHYIYFIYT
jgi:hypothetical protein